MRKELLLLDGIGNVFLGLLLLVAPTAVAGWLGLVAGDSFRVPELERRLHAFALRRLNRLSSWARMPHTLRHLIRDNQWP